MEKKLRKLGLEVINEGERHAEFKCAKRLVTVRRKRVLSESTKAKMAERMREMHHNALSCSES